MKENYLNEDPPEKKISLLRKFDIPIEHLDFQYINQCKDAREVEKILTVLRSGEEGHYPDLMKRTEEILVALKPKSRLLRVEKPVLRPEDLEKNEREAIQGDLSEWINITERKESESCKFAANRIVEPEINYAPIRGEEVRAISTQNETIPKSSKNFLKPSNPNRIKSWEYDKWDKLDIDAELTRLDIQDMQIKEWETHEKSKLVEEQKEVQLLMKNKDVEEITIKNRDDKVKVAAAGKPGKCSEPKMASFTLPKVQHPRNDRAFEVASTSLPKSFIEEIPMDKEIKNQTSGKKRVRVIIDDVNMGF